MNGRRVVVAGGTGNVGTFIVKALLEHGAAVTVPSRSERSLAAFRAHLQPRTDESSWKRLRTIVTDVAAADAALDPREPHAVVASLGTFIPAPSLLKASVADLDEVLHDYVRAHFAVAQRFLPALVEKRGTYIFING
ncbi:MAG TPA: SDR family NAD(P)-dependent oxidoreductase, partial [Thermoanaerobaculia bacterium]